jgi:hypothetical protein
MDTAFRGLNQGFDPIGVDLKSTWRPQKYFEIDEYGAGS